MVRQFTYDSGGGGATTIREELGDEIYILSPMDTPLHSLLGQRACKNTTFEWLVDDIATPTAVTAQFEGTTPVAGDRTRWRLQNNVMIDHLAIDVSETQRVVDEAAVADEFSWQIVHKGLELLKNMEFNMHWSNYVAGAESTARRTAGLIEWLVVGGQGRAANSAGSIAGRLLPVKFSPTVFEDVSTNITEALFRTNILQAWWRNGGSISRAIALMGGKMKQLISDFGVVYGSGTVINAGFIEAEKKRKVLTIDTYETDFGPLSMALDRYLDSPDVSTNFTSTSGSTAGGSGFSDTVQADETIVMFEPEFLELRVLRPLQYSPLDKDSDATKGYVVVEEGLCPKNPVAIAGGYGIAS